jgi:DNA transformation protein
MTVSKQFQEFLMDMLAPMHPSARRMFSGVGLFLGDAMFGLVVREALYLRVDADTRARFEEAGSEPFHYRRGDREVSIAAWYAAPEELLDRPDELLRWASEAAAVARAAKRRPKASARRPR